MPLEILKPLKPIEPFLLSPYTDHLDPDTLVQRIAYLYNITADSQSLTQVNIDHSVLKRTCCMFLLVNDRTQVIVNCNGDFFIGLIIEPYMELTCVGVRVNEDS